MKQLSQSEEKRIGIYHEPRNSFSIHLAGHHYIFYIPAYIM